MLCFQGIFVQALGMLAFTPLIRTKCSRYVVQLIAIAHGVEHV